MQTPFELEDIQGLLVFGHGHLRRSTYVFLRFKDGGIAQARAWLGQLAGEISTAKPSGRDAAGARVKAERALQVAFTASGLRALGLSDEVLKTFLDEFREGMADENRLRVLGDLNGSSPEHWDYGGPKNPVHVALMLYAENHAALEAYYEEHRARFEKGGLELVFRQDTELRQENREPFGFRDGIAQPAIEGLGAKPTSNEPPTKPGEFILGYPNIYGERPFSPYVPRELDRQGVLPEVKGDAKHKDFGRNGTYMVIRKLEQDVDGFWRFFEEKSVDPATGKPDPKRKEWLAAKFMGRWKSGAPLALCPNEDDAEFAKPEKRNDFLYAKDREGYGCPMGAHVRRSNPRDVLSTEDPKGSLMLSARHRILRRGRPYREKDGNGGPEKQGMMFIALNTNIGRQFEFIQQTWLNNPKFNGMYSSRDPAVGPNHEPGADGPEGYTMVIPREPVRERLTGIPRFVHTRGGGYFFLPGVRAVRFLAGV